MYELVLPAGSLIVLGFAVLRWRAHDLHEHGELTRGAAAFTAICIWLHGWLVALAAYDGLGRVGAGSTPVVVLGAVFAAAGLLVAAACIRRLGWARVMGFGAADPDGSFRALAATGWAFGLVGLAIAGQSLGVALLAGPVVWALAVFAERARAARPAVGTAPG